MVRRALDSVRRLTTLCVCRRRFGWRRNRYGIRRWPGNVRLSRRWRVHTRGWRDNGTEPPITDTRHQVVWRGCQRLLIGPGRLRHVAKFFVAHALEAQRLTEPVRTRGEADFRAPQKRQRLVVIFPQDIAPAEVEISEWIIGVDRDRSGEVA